MSFLRDLQQAFEELGYSTDSFSETMIALLDEDGDIVLSIEDVEAWIHLRLPMNIDCTDADLRDSLLLANDRALGFRFSVDAQGECFAASDVLSEDEDIAVVIRIAENMLHCAPFYASAFIEFSGEKSRLTDSDLDAIADAIHGKLH